jgi:hypothetical protein
MLHIQILMVGRQAMARSGIMFNPEDGGRWLAFAGLSLNVHVNILSDKTFKDFPRAERDRRRQGQFGGAWWTPAGSQGAVSGPEGEN